MLGASSVCSPTPSEGGCSRRGLAILELKKQCNFTYSNVAQACGGWGTQCIFLDFDNCQLASRVMQLHGAQG